VRRRRAGQRGECGAQGGETKRRGTREGRPRALPILPGPRHGAGCAAARISPTTPTRPHPTPLVRPDVAGAPSRDAGRPPKRHHRIGRGGRRRVHRQRLPAGNGRGPAVSEVRRRGGGAYLSGRGGGAQGPGRRRQSAACAGRSRHRRPHRRAPRISRPGMDPHRAEGPPLLGAIWGGAGAAPPPHGRGVRLRAGQLHRAHPAAEPVDGRLANVFPGGATGAAGRAGAGPGAVAQCLDSSAGGALPPPARNAARHARCLGAPRRSVGGQLHDHGHGRSGHHRSRHVLRAPGGRPTRRAATSTTSTTFSTTSTSSAAATPGRWSASSVRLGSPRRSQADGPVGDDGQGGHAAVSGGASASCRCTRR
jgi:hypothetical protein